jgi:hypothetical protein
MWAVVGPTIAAIAGAQQQAQNQGGYQNQFMQQAQIGDVLRVRAPEPKPAVLEFQVETVEELSKMDALMKLLEKDKAKCPTT